MTNPREHALILDVDLPARVGRVWTALTTSYGLRAWWWAQWDDVAVSVDARDGGAYRFTADAAGIVLEGVYREVDRDAGRLTYTWEWSDENRATTDETVEIVLTASDDGSHLTVRHEGPWESREPADRYRAEWTIALDQLKTALTRRR